MFILLIFLFNINNISADKIKLADGYFVPWSFYLEGTYYKKYQGITYDIGKLLSDKLNMELDFQILPYARVFKMLKSGEIDINISITNRSIMTAVTTLEPALTNVNFFIYSLKKTPIDISTLNRGKKTGIIRGTQGMWDKWSTQQGISMNYYEAENFNTLIKMLHSGRLDCIIVSEMSFLYENRILNKNLTDYAVPIFMFSNPWSLHISSNSSLNNPEFIEHLTDIIIRLKSEGQFEKIKKKYSKNIYDNKK